MNAVRALLWAMLLSGLVLCGWHPALAEDCLTSGCHPRLDNLEAQHDPVSWGGCESCHLRKGKNHPLGKGREFEAAVTGGDLCLQCHEVPGAGEQVHYPTAEGECLSCHDPHGGPGAFLRNQGQLSGICLECHDATPFQQEFLHGPAAVGNCDFCHDPHRSEQARLLRKPVRELCLGCHQDFRDMETAQVVHPPVRDDACTTCHNPHGAPTPNLLADQQPGVCTECHEGIDAILQNATTLHAPLAGADTCGACHSSHFSEHAGLLPDAQEDLCLGCHGRKRQGGASAAGSLAADLENRAYLHGPVAEGECSACHDPHGTGTFRLLNQAYPADFYVPFEPGRYDFCLQCHDENLLRFRETSLYTAFRNGKRNLHYVHVADSRKGRSCRACHEPHASDRPKMISARGPRFGDWRIPINFEITDTGGSCSPGCHQAFAYDREQPVDYDPAQAGGQ